MPFCAQAPPQMISAAPASSTSLPSESPLTRVSCAAAPCPSPQRPCVRTGAQRDSGVALAPRGRDPRSGTRRGRGAARAAAAVAGRAVRDAHAAAHAAQPPRLAVHPTEPPPPPSSKPRPFPPPPPRPPSPPSLSHAPPHRALPLPSNASRYVATLLASLQWVHMLLQKSGPRVMQLSQQARSPIDLPSISYLSSIDLIEPSGPRRSGPRCSSA